MYIAIGMVSRSVVAGRASGEASVNVGTATRAKPKPIDPCTTAPNPIATTNAKSSTYATEPIRPDQVITFARINSRGDPSFGRL